MRARRIAPRFAAIAAGLVACVAGVAWAHATLVHSDPAHEARLRLPPPALHLVFSEAVNPRTSRIELVAPDSQRIGLAVRADSTDGKALFADVAALPTAGRYRVEWRLVGPDGHAVTGKYSFTVDSIPIVPPSQSDSTGIMPVGQEGSHEPPNDTLVQQGIRFLSFLSMVVVIGSIAFASWVLPKAVQSTQVESHAFGREVEGRLRALGAIGAWSLLILAVVRLTSHALTLSGSVDALRIGDFADVLTNTTFGRGWFLQVTAAVGLVWGFRAGMKASWAVLSGAAVLLAVSAPLLGHPAAVPDMRLVAIGLDGAHVLAAGGWVGGILMLSTAVVPQVFSLPVDDRIDAARNLLRAFTPLALTCAAILAVTGLAGAWLQLRDLGLVLGSPYGMMVVRKVVVVLAIAALGAYHWRVVQPSMADERSLTRLRTSIAFDVVLALLVLIITTALTGTAPPVR